MFTQKLKELRRNRRLSQGELSKVFNVAQQTVGKWESGLAYPNIDTLKQVAKYFNVSIDYLLDNENENTKKELTLNEKQTKLINGYENLNDEGQNMLLGILASLQQSHAKTAIN